MTQCACGSCNTEVVTQYSEYKYRGYVQEVERSYTECQDCGLEFMTAEQINSFWKLTKKADITIQQWILDNPEEE